MKPALREIRDFFLGPVDGDPWEQNVCRLGWLAVFLIVSYAVLRCKGVL